MFVATIAINTAITVLPISSGCINAFAQTFEIDVKKKNTKLFGKELFPEMYDIKSIH